VLFCGIKADVGKEEGNDTWMENFLLNWHQINEMDLTHFWLLSFGAQFFVK
jgi:hypothetical protein